MTRNVVIWGRIMIILLNVEKQKLQLYGKEGLVEIPFIDAAQLLDYTEDRNVFYITNAIEASGQDIIDTIKGMGVKVQEDTFVDGGVKYLHGSSEGTIYIHEHLKFEGRFDCKILDESLSQEIQRTPLLQKLIQGKKIKIIGEAQRRRLMKDFKNSEVKRMDKQKQIDDALSGIIINEKVEDYKGMPDDEHTDAIGIDLMSRAPMTDTGGMGTMSELMNQIDGLE